MRESSVSVAALARDGRVTELPGIGKTLEEKIDRARRDRRHPGRRQAAREVPERADRRSCTCRASGPKRARRLYDELGIDSLDALRAAARGGPDPRAARVRRRRPRRTCSRRWPTPTTTDGPAPRVLLLDARCAIAEQIVERAARPSGRRARRARRLAAAAGRLGQGPRHHRHRRRPRRAGRGAARAATRSSRCARPARRARGCMHPHRPEGRPAGRRARPVRQPAPALHRLQGAQRGAARVRGAARAARLRVRDPRRRDRRDACAARPRRRSTRRSGCDWIPPELREGRGELEAARPAGRACRTLIELDDLRGDLHCHTTLSDGARPLEEMAAAARARAATSTSRSPTTRPRTGSATTSRRTRCAARIERGPRARTRARRVRAAGRHRGQHPPRRLARLRRRAARAARLGDRLGPHLVPDGRAGR